MQQKLETEIGHWLDRLDDKYCMLVPHYSIQDVRDTAQHFAEWGFRNAYLEASCDKTTEINVLKDLLKVVTGKDTFDEAISVALNALHEAKMEVAQEQIPYDCYEKLECFAEKLYVNQNENQYGDGKVSV